MLNACRRLLRQCLRAGFVPLLVGLVALQGCGGGGSSSAAGGANGASTATAPGAPSGITAVVGNGSVMVSWTAPADGGSAISGYTVTASPGGASVTVAGTVTSATISGLTNGTAYTFTVVASNAVGLGTPSAASAPATPVAVPVAPASVSATAGNASAQVSWPAPTSNDGSAITGFTVTAYVMSGNAPTATGLTATAGAGATALAFPGLANGTGYAFTVIATNAVGNSLPSPLSNTVTPATVPDAPTSVVATGGNAVALVSWVAPAPNGSAITGYTITASDGSTATAPASATSATISGLTNGLSYTFTVTASNALGNGSPSASSNAVTPVDVPGAPTGVAAVAGDGNALVSWTAPASIGGTAITGYTVTIQPGGGTLSAGTNTSVTVAGLANGTAYTFTVTAANSAGTGLPSTASAPVTPAGLPGVPTNVQATAGNTTASVSWSAPAANGSTITGYTVSVITGGSTVQTVNTSGTTLTVTGLVNGTSYTFTVAAINGVGTGTASAASGAVTPAAVPGTPSNVVATRGNASAVVSWTAPSAGGSPITGYTVTPSIGSAVVLTGTATSTTITGLTNGTAYTFTVAATNAVGTGLASAPSAPVTPATTPGAPTGVTASPGNTNALVSWTAPSTGGSPITGYTVKASSGATASVAGTSTSLTFSGLTNGTSYTFTVTATNALGNGPASTASAPVTPSVTSIAVAISPRQAGITLSQTQQFTATVTGTSNTAVNWSVDGTVGGNATTLGTISVSGLYTPPTLGTLGGAHVITATSQADSTKSATATLGVTDLAGVFTYHNDIARTGQNLQEYALNPTNVAASFGKLFSCPLDGAVYAQPLYVANLNLGAAGVHNVVFVVTMNDSVYAFDADSATCHQYWFQNFLLAGAVAVPVSDITNAGDVPGTFGIMGTPVIGNSRIYFVDRTRTGVSPNYTYTEQLHALDLATGNEITNSPVTITASYPGNAQGGSTVSFDPKMQAQRPALLLLNNIVYIAFGSAGDVTPYFGWILGYDANTLAQTATFNSDPSTDPTGPGRGAFWLCGSGPASDGTSIFVATANGVFNNTGSVIPPVAPLNDMGDSLLKLGPTLAIQDFFTPSDQLNDYTNDVDFGSAGVVVLPNSMGSASHAHLVIATGKPGKFYMDDRDTMAKYDKGAQSSDANVQTLAVNASGIWSTPAIWGSNLYLGGFSAPLRAYSVINGQISATYTMQTADTISQSGGTPSISAMGTGQTAASNPIVWILDNGANGASFGGTYGPAILKAFDATNLAKRLYSSATSSADTAGNAVKFTVPTVANGKVYVADGGPTLGSSGQLTVYGLKP